VVCFALLAFSFALIAGWWYGRNWMLYGDITGLNPMLGIMGRREPGFGFADLIPELEGIRRSYWALFGQTNVVLSASLYFVCDFLSLVARIGWVVLIYRAWRAHRWNEIAWLALLALWFVMVAAVWRGGRSRPLARREGCSILRLARSQFCSCEAG
jgi:hypothetical protein